MRSIAPWLRPRSGAVAARFCAFGLIAACDGSAAPPIPPPRPPPDAVDAAPHRDAVAGDLGGEVGDGVGTPCTATLECATGICRRGVCGPLCADDDACPAGFHCAPDAGGLGACVRTCDGAGACPFGLFCVADAPGRGACVAHGPLPAGAACRGPDDCAARTCVDGRCPSSCGPETGCPPGQACLPLHVGGVCVEAGAGAPEAPCGSGSACRSGVCRGGGCSEACDATVSPDPCPGDRRCVPYETLALCERPCVSAGDCGSHGLCLAEGDTVLCQSRGGGAAGDACERPADCRSGHCSGGRCDPECGAGCPPATACVRDVTGATCRPAGAQPENAPCSTGAECRSGFCAAGRCGRDCAEGPDCPAGMACIGFASGRFCFPRCQIDSDCEAPAYCADALGAEPVCFWRGAVSDGAACRQDFECRSGLCRGEICLPPCPDAVCPGGLECRDFGRGPFCTGVPAPLGAECSTAEACAAGLGCEAGRCLPPLYRRVSAGCPLRPRRNELRAGLRARRRLPPGVRLPASRRPAGVLRTSRRISGRRPVFGRARVSVGALPRRPLPAGVQRVYTRRWPRDRHAVRTRYRVRERALRRRGLHASMSRRGLRRRAGLRFRRRRARVSRAVREGKPRLRCRSRVCPGSRRRPRLPRRAGGRRGRGGALHARRRVRGHEPRLSRRRVPSPLRPG